VAKEMCFFYNGQLLEQALPEQIFNHTRHKQARQFLDAIL
jgi:ABC-type phosphate transport system ATPase subunit